MSEEIVNPFTNTVLVDEKQKMIEIRKSIREYRASQKAMFGSKLRKKPLINRFSDKVKMTIS